MDAVHIFHPNPLGSGLPPATPCSAQGCTIYYWRVWKEEVGIVKRIRWQNQQFCVKCCKTWCSSVLPLWREFDSNDFGFLSQNGYGYIIYIYIYTVRISIRSFPSILWNLESDEPQWSLGWFDQPWSLETLVASYQVDAENRAKTEFEVCKSASANEVFMLILMCML